MKKITLAVVAVCAVSFGAVSMSFARAEAPVEAPKAEPAGDIIARVGDQAITFSEINTTLNSSAIVGLSVPALGTPERDTVRITLLDRFVSANLLYLDARKQGLDKDPAYQREVERFNNAILAGLYRQQLAGEVVVSDEEVQANFKQNFIADTELTPDIRAGIESKLRHGKFRQQLDDMRKQAHDGGVEVVVHEENLALADDAERADSVVLAEIDGESVTWGAVKEEIIAAGKGAVIADPLAKEEDARSRALDTEINVLIMTKKARAAGLDQNPVYRARAGEFQKTRLINLHRDQLLQQITPTDEELKGYYVANQADIAIPEARKIQMVVLKTREEADQIKARIDAGELNMFQAAQEFSIAATAKDDLGEVGWVYQGDTVPELDKVIFELGPGALSNPVETPAGWHLVIVQDLQEEKYGNFEDSETRKLTRSKYLNQKLDEYVVKLRENEFPVEVYQDVLVRLAQQEADMVEDLAEKAEEPASITRQRLDELGKTMKSGGVLQ